MKLCMLKSTHGDELLIEVEETSTDLEKLEAKRLFEYHKNAGCLMFGSYGHGNQQLIQELDLKFPKILVIPLIQGG